MASLPVQPMDLLTDPEVIARRNAAVDQIRWMRQYTMELIESVPLDRWYERPAGTVTNLAWQVGHLAVSQYGLMLFRQRGRAAEDRELMPGWLRKRFGRGTSPPDASEDAPAPNVLLEHLQRVHARSVEVASGLDADALREPVDPPYAVHPTRLGALLFCPLHEAIHAGQIGLLRRSLGLAPVR